MELIVGEINSGNLLIYKQKKDEEWSRQTIDQDLGRITGLAVGYLDQNGYPDVILSTHHPDLITWYRNQGSDPIQWIKDTIEYSRSGPRLPLIVDVNGDGSPDLVTTWVYPREICW